MNPDENLFESHLREAPFKIGVDEAKWGIHAPEEEKNAPKWPTRIVWVQAEKSFVPTERIYLKFSLDGYSKAAPTACPWNIERNTALEAGQWPKGTPHVNAVFNPNWNSQALYAPCDRIAMVDHDQWKTVFPQWWWQSSFTIVKYLQFVHQTLNPNYANT